MRVAGIVLAVLLIAACPPRRGRVVYVRPCPTPCVIVSAPPASPPIPAAKTTDPAVDAHLAAWEKSTANIQSVRSEISLTRTDEAFKKDTSHNGVVLWLKPNYLIMRLERDRDLTKTDYEAYICDGKSLYVYQGLQKTITEVKLPLKWPCNNHVIMLLAEPKVKDINERFEVSLFKTDDRYIYLDFKPRGSDEAKEFTSLRLALYGPGEATAKFAYLPAQASVLKPNGERETWKFSNPRVDISGVKASDFKYTEIPGWKVQREPEKP